MLQVNSIKKGRRFFGCVVLALFVYVPGAALAIDYGKTGPYSVVRETLKNPVSGDDVTVFLPQNAPKPMPVMFFSHGLGGNYYTAYKSMLNHVASQGVAVVFSPYPTNASWTEQYDLLWGGFEKAASVHKAEFDFQQVGFFGHSWGGGATPNMASRAVEKGWGQRGMLMFIMAPGPDYGVTDQDLNSLSAANLIVQSFENDTVVPESIAKEIYAKIGVPDQNKAYYFISGGNHTEPSERAVNDYDKLAIWTPLDALMDATFDMGDPNGGRAFALDGEGEHYQTTIDSAVSPTDDTPRWKRWVR